jgi:hypothetical protein
MTKAQLFDVLERAGWTAVQAALGTFMAVTVIDGAVIQEAAVIGLSAFVGALASFLKGFVAVHYGKGTASTLPEKYEPKQTNKH